MKKAYFPVIFSIFLCSLFLMSTELNAQGCVAVRPMSCSGNGYSNGSALLPKGHFQLAANYRYFQSYKHFRGDVEEHERVEAGTEVINTTHSVDFSATYALTSQVNLSLNVPLIYNHRTSLYEHYGNSPTANPEQKRFATQSQGLGDMRLSASYWLFKQGKDSLGNIAFGAGLKMPTGNSNVQGTFHRRTPSGGDSTITKGVDQSIQLGDGGFGFTIEMQGYRKFGSRLSLYYNAFYLFNPQNVNKTVNRTVFNSASDYIIRYHSIADQYMARVGMNFKIMENQGLFVNLGGRAEGIPYKDIIGKSEGFRRPGYIVSVEPGVTYFSGKHTFVVNVPIALYRNRVKSVYDRSDPNVTRHGDAAFADYLINFTYLFRFGKSHDM